MPNPLATSSGPARDYYAITPADADLPTPVRGIYVGGSGNIALRSYGSTTTVTLTGVVVGTVLQIEAAQVRSTGTTATNLIGLL